MDSWKVTQTSQKILLITTCFAGLQGHLEVKNLRNHSLKHIKSLEDFATRMEDPKYSSNDRYIVVMVDNTSIHTSHKFIAKVEGWMIEKKLIVCFLPTYSQSLTL